MSETAVLDRSAAAVLRLSCRPTKVGHALVFPYVVENLGPIDAYVMDATPGVDPATHQPCANEQAAVVLLGPDNDAVVGKFIAPLPTDRRIAVPVIPLARHVPAGTVLERRLEIPSPLAETSPYFPDLPLRRYAIFEVAAVILTIGYWVAGVDYLVATPAEHAPSLFSVVTRHTARSAQRLTARLPTSGLQVFRRSDRFARTLD